MLYLRDMEHIEYNIRCDHNVHTSNASNKKRHWKIKSMHVGVKLLDQHEWTSDWDVTYWLPSTIVNDSGLVSVGEVWQEYFAFWMNALSREVLKEVHFGILIMEHVICNSKNIMGSTQSNPISTYVDNKVNTHLRMYECERPRP